MRYALIVNFEGGVVDTPMEEWKPEEITAHLDYYKALHKELVSSGELVDSQVLAGPNLAKIVTSDGLNAPVVTDGPFQEFKEWLAGYQIVEVDSEARAIEIAAKISAVPGRRDGGIPATGGRRALNVPRVSRTCCATLRRRSWARSFAGLVTSTLLRTQSRRHCSRPPCTGRAMVFRRSRAGGSFRPLYGG